MKFLEEYRDAKLGHKYTELIHRNSTREWNIMEICGGQTHTIIRQGIDTLLKGNVNFIHGPGCPVCVTPISMIDKAINIASVQGVIFCTYGDMLRVPGSYKDLASVRAKGADVRIICSPLNAVKIAEDNPTKDIVFFAIGFETTAPANALAIWQAYSNGVKNFYVLVSHVTVPPALKTILDSPECKINGVIAAGHVCTVMGYNEYLPISKEYKIPIVVTGFEPIDILQGTYMLIKQLERGKHFVENQYSRSVKPEGNKVAQNLFSKIFETSDKNWRGIGLIPNSGYKLKKDFSMYDAELKFNSGEGELRTETISCIAGKVLQGLIKPNECELFGIVCNPVSPVGAPMVSTEGACAAYYRYSRRNCEAEIV